MLLAKLMGRRSNIDLVVGETRHNGDVPLVAAAELGYSPLGVALSRRTEADVPIRAVANHMAAAEEDGLLLALCDVPNAPRRFGLVQTNRGPGFRRNFYERRHVGRDRVWRDFYYAAAYVLFALMNERWPNTTDVELAHPTGHGWLTDLAPSFFDGLGHLADEQRLDLRKIHVNRCCLDNDDEMRSAFGVLNEIQRSAPTRHRPLDVESYDVSRLGLRPHPGISVFRVPLQQPS